jgi:hypothetical protein
MADAAPAAPKPPSKILSILKKILIGFVATLAVFAIVVALQPPDFAISRSASMAASLHAVFSQVDDFHRWEAWSPWAKIDPAMKQTYGGAPSGTGAVYSWAGNDEVGEGRMTILESRAGELVRIKLEFLKPFAATNQAEFTFKSDGAQTSVTWTMTGRKNFIQKAFCLFMDMDKMVGGDFEKGLAQMKAAVEKK